MFGHPRSAAIIVPLALVAAGCGARPTVTPAATFDPDSVPDAYAHASGALMWPGATRAFEITPAGDLFNGDWFVHIRPSSGSIAAAGPRRIAFEDRWMPVAHWRRASGPVRWDFEAVPLAGPSDRDTGLIVSLQVIATNGGSSPAPCRIAFALANPDTIPPFAAFDAPEPPRPLRWGTGSAPDTVQGWGGSRAETSSLDEAWTLAPGASRALRVVLPVYPARAGALERWARTPHARRADEARSWWNAALARGARFDLGDPATEDALRGALVVLLSCRERRGSSWIPIGGPFQYRDLWLRDGARAVAALAVAGFTDESRALAAGMSQLQLPSGAFMTQVGQLDGTGQELWALEQAMLRPAVADSIGRYARIAERAWAWFEWQRGLGRQSGWTFGSLMPFADPRDNELTRTQLVGSDAWAIAGYRAAARLLAAAGDSTRAGEVERTRAGYLADFAHALDVTGSRDIPPCWQGAGRDWGNLAVGVPCAALPLDDPRLASLARRVWASAGGAGLCSFANRDSLHYYLGADIATWGLMSGRRASADSVLEALLHWRTASGTAGEAFSTWGDFGRNLPPHPTSAAALVTLIRNAIVYDDGDTLRLTLGARGRWWRGARVHAAPTRWGAIDLAFRRDGDFAQWTWSPMPVWTALTLPPGTRIDGTPDPPIQGRADAGVVLAPPGTGTARVRVAPDEGASP